MKNLICHCVAGGELVLGSQICWVLRPFIRDPTRPVEFIGREYFHGLFFETVFEAHAG
jgi:hypothetical protein